MFEYTELEREKVLSGYFLSLNPLRLRLFPPKQKKQFIALNIILEKIDKTKLYQESELNELLKSIYPDFVTLRRGLIDYRLMSRKKDCSQYWVREDL